MTQLTIGQLFIIVGLATLLAALAIAIVETITDEGW